MSKAAATAPAAPSGAAPSATMVDLNTLNKKQLTKEYKTVSKEIKSKDMEVKVVVLEKLKDHRYFLEGGCFVPFLESLTPKKVTIHFIF